MKICGRDGCTNPKRPGQGQRLCEACHADSLTRFPKTIRPCQKCGSVENKQKGRQLCDPCKEVADWRAQTRRRAKKAAARKVCAGCLKRKDPGERKRYCKACAATRADPRRTCNACGELKLLTKWAKNCEDCKRESRKRRNARQVEYARRVRRDPERGPAMRERDRQSKRRRRKHENERARMYYRLKALDAGRPVGQTPRPYTRDKARTSALPLRPLIDRFERVWLAQNDTQGGSGAIGTLSDRAGVSVRLIYRIRFETDAITIDAADKLCIALGTAYSLVYATEEEAA